MAFSVASALDRYIESHREERDADGYWHPSGMFACDRKVQYSFHGVPQSNPPDARAQRVFAVGHKMHEILQEAIADDPAVSRVFPEVSVISEDLKVKGHGDTLLFRDGVWELLELKSMKSTAFKYKDLPRDDHVAQLCTYIYLLRTYGGYAQGMERGYASAFQPLGDALARGRIVYVSKDDLLISEHPVLWTPARQNQVLQRLATLKLEEVSWPKLPPRLPMVQVGKKQELKRDWQCGYCPWQDRCWYTDDDEYKEGTE